MGKPGVRLADASIERPNPTYRANGRVQARYKRANNREILGSDGRPSLVGPVGLNLWNLDLWNLNLWNLDL